MKRTCVGRYNNKKIIIFAKSELNIFDSYNSHLLVTKIDFSRQRVVDFNTWLKSYRTTQSILRCLYQIWLDLHETNEWNELALVGITIKKIILFAKSELDILVIIHIYKVTKIDLVHSFTDFKFLSSLKMITNYNCYKVPSIYLFIS